MQVYVKSKSGKWLMPTNPANARIMLKDADLMKLMGYTMSRKNGNAPISVDGEPSGQIHNNKPENQR